MNEHPDQAEQAEQDRALLRAHDPAAALPPLDAPATHRLLEDAMRETPPTETPPTETPQGYATREAGSRHRSPLTWLVAAAAVLVLAGVTWAGLALGDRDTQTPGTAAPSAPAAPPTAEGAGGGAPEEITRLEVPSEAAARCMVPRADVLAQQQLAFEGTVTSVTDRVVTFETDRWFAGEATPRVEVDALDPSLQRLLVAPDFREGGRYLVSATDGQVSLCGFSDAASPRLLALYEQAFG